MYKSIAIMLDCYTVRNTFYIHVYRNIYTVIMLETKHFLNQIVNFIWKTGCKKTCLPHYHQN